jgi:lipopolysaccharide export system permease protein
MIKELIVPFVIGTIAVVLMFQANLLIFMFKTFSMSSVPFPAIAKLLLYKTPFFLDQTLPVGMALATSLAMSRLVRESELTAMRAAGASILRIILPISFFGLLVGVGNFYLVEKVMPPAEKEYSKLSNRMAIVGALPDFKSNVTFPLQDYDVSIRTIYKQPNNTLQLDDVILVERPQLYEYRVFTAMSGTYEDGVWRFPNARCWRFKGDEFFDFAAKDLVITQPININDALYGAAQPTEMSMRQLTQAIKDQRALKQDTAPLEIQYQERFSVPAACYVFSVVGPVFAVWLGRGGGFVGVLLSIMMVMLYYNVFIISTEIFGKNHWVSPLIAAWLPNLLFVGLALFGLRRLE